MTITYRVLLSVGNILKLVNSKLKYDSKLNVINFYRKFDRRKNTVQNIFTFMVNQNIKLRQDV